MDHSSHMNTRKMGAYWSLAVQTFISGVIMYLVMFVMIDGLDSFYNNLNMLYMTLMMVAPMVVLMILAHSGAIAVGIAHPHFRPREPAQCSLTAQD